MVFKKEIVQFWIIGLVVLAAFFGSLILTDQPIFLSPDETANAFFTDRFVKTGSLMAFESLNTNFFDLLHPRSMRSLNGFLVPTSFPGLPVIYGVISFFLGSAITPLLTPLFALLAVLAFWDIAKKYFGEKIGFYSALLLAIHPAWWYYSARTMMHNVLFTSLLIFAAYFLLVKNTSKRLGGMLPAIFSGLLVSLSLFVRLSEIIWVLGGFILLFLLNRSSITKKQVIGFLLGLVIGVFPILTFNYFTYGSPLETGYTVSGTPLPTPLVFDAPMVEGESGLRSSIESVLAPLFPFGIHPRAVLQNFGAYALLMFWWFTLPACIGFYLLFPRASQPKEKRKHMRTYYALFAFISIFLFVMYGSWRIMDNPDPDAITIGQSYIRYWLPFFVLSIPFVAKGLEWLVQQTRNHTEKLYAVIGIILVMGGFSFYTVFYGQSDSLIPSKAVLERSQIIQEAVLEIVPEDAVMVTDRADKLFFPQRTVLQPLRNETHYALLPRLVLRVPVYYYGITFPPQDLEYLNTKKLKDLGLRITLLQTFDAESLYIIEKVAL